LDAPPISVWTEYCSRDGFAGRGKQANVGKGRKMPGAIPG
jgi:hypothetical protein